MLNRIIIILCLILVGCDNGDIMGPQSSYDFQIEIENNYLDENGYYHIQLNPNSQTLQKITGHTNNPNIQKVYWNCDTMLEMEYQGQLVLVPIINNSSYTNDDGDAFVMLGPHPEMAGDTITVIGGYTDNFNNIDYESYIFIVLNF